MDWNLLPITSQLINHIRLRCPLDSVPVKCVANMQIILVLVFHGGLPSRSPEIPQFLERFGFNED